MFQLETANIRFKHRVICSKGYWGSRSPKVIQGHLGSLSAKNKIIEIPHILLNYSKNLKLVILVYNQSSKTKIIYDTLSSDQLLRSPVIGRLTVNTEPYSGLTAAPG